MDGHLEVNMNLHHGWNVLSHQQEANWTGAAERDIRASLKGPQTLEKKCGTFADLRIGPSMLKYHQKKEEALLLTIASFPTNLFRMLEAMGSVSQLYASFLDRESLCS